MAGQSVTQRVKDRMDLIEDLTDMADAAKKKAWLNETATVLGASRATVEAVFSKHIGTLATARGQNPEQFQRKKAPKYSGKIAANPHVEPKAIGQERGGKAAPAPAARPGTKQAALATQNPNAMAAVPVVDDLPLEHVIGSVDSFVMSFFDDVPEMTEQERKDGAACLKMALGTYLDTHERVRALFGLAGLAGIYGGRIKTARKTRKEKKAAEQKATSQKRDQIEKAVPQQAWESETQRYLDQIKKKRTDDG